MVITLAPLHHVNSIPHEIIERYPDDTPYPSILLLGFPGGRPLHVVAAEVVETGETFVITVYEPDPDLWDRERKRRKTP